MKALLGFSLLLLLIGTNANADDNQDVDTTHIKANKELPKVLYVVPWKDLEARKDTEEKLVLHDFFGVLYEPVLPDDVMLQDTRID
jgi:hypothetical protein